MAETVVRGAGGWICWCCPDTLYCQRLAPDAKPDGVEFVEAPMPEPMGTLHKLITERLEGMGMGGRKGPTFFEGAKADRDKPEPRCFCGIEIARADDLCTERDCPYRRYPLR